MSVQNYEHLVAWEQCEIDHDVESCGSRITGLGRGCDPIHKVTVFFCHICIDLNLLWIVIVCALRMSDVLQTEQKKQAAADVLFHYSQFVMVCIGEDVRPTDLRLHLMKVNLLYGIHLSFYHGWPCNSSIFVHWSYIYIFFVLKNCSLSR